MSGESSHTTRIEAAAKAIAASPLGWGCEWNDLTVGRDHCRGLAQAVLAAADAVERPVAERLAERPEWQRCPVCEGRGWMPHGFFSGTTSATSLTNETCLACNGSRMVPYPDHGQAPTRIDARIEYHNVTRERLITFQREAHAHGDAIAVDIAAECIRLMGLARFWKQRAERPVAERLAAALREFVDPSASALMMAQHDYTKSSYEWARIQRAHAALAEFTSAQPESDRT